MKIVILGCGFVGGVLSKLLSKEDKVSQIVCCDLKNKEERKEGKLIFKKLDVLNQEQLNEFLKSLNPNIVVNTLHPKFNKLILESCLANKVNYIDTASFWEIDSNKDSKSPYKVEQLEYDEAFKKNKLTGLINSGVSPGLTNLLAKEASCQLDEVDSIKIRLIEDTRSEKLYFPWCVEWLLDEIASVPLVFSNGDFKLAKRFSGGELFDFKEPFGQKKVSLFCQEEVGTIPLFIKAKNVDIKGYDSQSEIAEFLIKLGLVSEKKIKIDNSEISPRVFLANLLEKEENLVPKKSEIANAQFGLAVTAEGIKDSKQKKVSYFAVFPIEKEIDKLNLGANFISYPTALMLKTFIMNFSEIKRFGVFSPETLTGEIRKAVLDDLKKSGIVITLV